MRFPQTNEKLVRTERLLKMLEEKQKEPKGFDALLDSVVQAGRSVTFVLKTEITRTRPDLLEWYGRETTRMKTPENSALGWLKNARNFSTKEEPLGVGTKFHVGSIHIASVAPGEGFAITGRGEPVRLKFDRDGNEIESRHAAEFDSEIQARHFIVKPMPPSPLLLNSVDLSGQDAVTILKASLAYLRDLVTRAETA